VSYTKNNPYINLEEQEVDLKEIVSMVLRYKKSIVLVVFLITLVATTMAYMSNNRYVATLTLRIDVPKSNKVDIIATATGSQSANMGDEVTLLRSRFLAKKVLEKVFIGNRYYDNSGYKPVELYTRSPFQVKVDKITSSLINEKFHISPVDKEHFKLMLNIKAKHGHAKISYEKVHKYGSLIKNKLFTISVKKVSDIRDKEYLFTFVPNEQMYPAIQSSLSVIPSQGKSSILILAYRDNVVQRAEDILNELARAYRTQSIKYKSNSAEKTLKFIDKQLSQINKSLDMSASNLRDYKSLHVIMSVANKTSVASGVLSKYQDQMAELMLQESTLENLLRYVKYDKDVVGIDLGVINGGSSAIATLIGQMQDARTLKSSLLVDYTEKHPSVLKANEQIRSLKKSLLATIEGSLRTIKHRKKSLDKMIDKYTKSLSELPEEEKQLAELNRKYKVNQNIYEFLLKKRSETAIIESSTVSSVHVIDDAFSNGSAVEPKRLLMVAMGVIIGLVLGVIQALARNALANKIQTIGDIEGKTNLPIYATLPFFKDKKSLYEDALRVLLTKIEFNHDNPKIITLTSSTNGEGRTTTAVEFAKIIGQSGKKVLVMDMDMRNSRVKEKLSIDNEAGVSSYLSHEKELSEIIHNVDKLVDVIIAGPFPENPYEMISSLSFKNMLGELSKSYDFILLESPPAGLVADAILLMRMSDFNLIVFKAGYSKKDFVNSTNRFVHEHGLNNVGLVLNALELKKIRPWIKK